VGGGVFGGITGFAVLRLGLLEVENSFYIERMITVKNKRIFILLDAVALMASAMFAPREADADVTYLWIDGQSIVAGLDDDTTNDNLLSDGWKWDGTGAPDYVLTLNGSYDGGEIYINTSTDNVKIVVAGNVSITATSPAEPAIVLYGGGNLEITGSGTLSLRSNESKGLSVSGGGNLTISETVTVNSEGSSLTDAVGGIWCQGNVTIKDTATVSAKGTSAGVEEDGNAAGIWGVGNVTIQDGATVNATGNSATAGSAGIYSDAGDVAIQGTATVSAVGNGHEGNGIYADSGNLAIESGTTVNAVSHGEGYSLLADTGITIDSGSTVTLSADDSSHYSDPAPSGSGAGDVTYKINPVNSGSSGGCDAGFGLAGLLALGALFIARRKK
jgi:Synergist-CTERM protein sorting domain-containing protein